MKALEIKKALAGYTRITYNGVEIAKHYLSATYEGTREAFDIPEDQNVYAWLEETFANEIEIINQEN
jgi:hypothetical protein